jgi:hypothetical protein
MTEASVHVGVEPGEGLVARFGATAVVIAAAGPNQDPFTPALLTILDTGVVTPARVLAWQIAGLLAAHGENAPAFAVSLPEPTGCLVLLHGAARAEVAGGATPVALDGRTAVTWIDQLVPGPIGRISLTLAEQGPVQPDPRSDLRSGLVSGRGLVVTPNAATGPASAQPDPAWPEPAPTQAPDPSPDWEPAAPSEPQTPPVLSAADLPAASVSATLPAQPDPDPVAEDPTAFRPIVTQSVAAPPVSGVLLADDGSRTPLDRRYVFGRDPGQDPAVLSGSAAPIVVADPDFLVSRVQAYLSVEAGVVTVRDNGSANGTFIAAPGAADWTQLDSSASELPVGWSLRMGRRVYTYVAAG